MKGVAGMLLACLVSSLASGLGLLGCDERFLFDVSTAESGAGGTPSLADSAGASLGGAGAAAGAEPSKACGSHPACPSNLHCVDGQCYPCDVDSDCLEPGLGRCDRELHRCVACLTGTDCASGFACDTLANRCLQTCHEDRDCPAGAHGCDEHRRVCYQCDEDEECSKSTLGSLCAIDGSGCVQCRSELDCPQKHCDQLVGRCVECRDWHDCDSGLCDPLTGSCSP